VLVFLGFPVRPEPEKGRDHQSRGEPEFSFVFERQASAMDSVSFLGLFPPKVQNTCEPRNKRSCSSRG